MDSVATTVKSAINPAKILGVFIGFIIVAALAEVTGFTSFLLAPVSTIKSKFMKTDK